MSLRRHTRGHSGWIERRTSHDSARQLSILRQQLSFVGDSRRAGTFQRLNEFGGCDKIIRFDPHHPIQCRTSANGSRSCGQTIVLPRIGSNTGQQPKSCFYRQNGVSLWRNLVRRAAASQGFFFCPGGVAQSQNFPRVTFASG